MSPTGIEADLQRWRETFAEKLRGWGVDAEATRQRTRGEVRKYESIWRVKAGAEGRLRSPSRLTKLGEGLQMDRAIAAEAWSQLAEALCRSDVSEDRALALDVHRFISCRFARDPEYQSVARPHAQPSIPAIDQPLTTVARKSEGPNIRR